ncbi:tRNA (adenosine(37)-N6)-threonylcarbamoyltransferase complex ATPase subunit type 1 TsaE [Candidatus Avelusimicrobium stercoris]|uniref:tRNA (adenosine(37)-N6)-threonylcarbamoyltransferase complex ATPase subunit type 1 TsaE n=1 Tax=Candidatus Avelusimicrobium stercoris TaxID=1947924 RepID=UPI000ED75E98|nr:tRNA (adenosine(37)-N6)-threonylcarbamoyltransferase complex ATPase subunit type 1 TsaE [Elusimicrobiota bacterium]
MKTAEIATHSRAQTLALAERFSSALKGGEIVFLRGPIGAGKTVFVKGVAAALGLKSSPTSASFSLMKEYKNKKHRLFHIDLFRLEEGEVFNLGFEEMLEDEKAIILAEWPDPIRHMLPADRLEMDFILKEGDERVIKLQSFGRVSDALLEALCKAAKN